MLNRSAGEKDKGRNERSLRPLSLCSVLAHFAGVAAGAGVLGADGADAGVLEEDDESEEDVLAVLPAPSLDEPLPSFEVDLAAALLP